MHCNMFFHSILYPFSTLLPWELLGLPLVTCATLTCTFLTMTKSKFCNATNYGDSEALQKCLILSARINHFANQSNYSQNDVSFGTEVCKLLVKKVKNVTRSSSKSKEIWWTTIFVEHQSLFYIWSYLKSCWVGCPGPTHEAFSGPQFKIGSSLWSWPFPSKKLPMTPGSPFHFRSITVYYIAKYKWRTVHQDWNRKRCTFSLQAAQKPNEPS